MAILEKETSNYFKINFENCAVRGRAVYVNYSAYKTENDRQKEKDRAEPVAKFFVNLRQYLDEKYKELIAAIGEQKPEDLLSESEPDMIDKSKFPELRQLQETAIELLPYEQTLSNFLYQYGDEATEIDIPETILPKLNALGFDKEWISDPIHISSGAEVFCGNYNDEYIDMEFYYNRLKTVMNDNIVDC